MIRTTLVKNLTLALAVLGCAGCDRDASSAARPPAAPGDQQPQATGPGHGGDVVELGQARVGPFQARATRDVGPIEAGGEAPVDVSIEPAEGQDARVAAVRFWVGTEAAIGSIKVRGEIEDPADPTRWHNHVELPDPIPAESRLWVEVETEEGERHLGSFALGADGA